MVTGASTADLAVILIDARKGVLTQTRRHSYLAHLLGIRHIVLAVNKMDLVGYDQPTYDAIVADYRRLRGPSIGIDTFVPIPISGFRGDNIADPFRRETPWYDGPTLIQHLEAVDARRIDADQARGFAMPVQWVNRPNLDFPRLCWARRERAHRTGRSRPHPALGQDVDGRADRHARRRPRRRRSRASR